MTPALINKAQRMYDSRQFTMAEIAASRAVTPVTIYRNIRTDRAQAVVTLIANHVMAWRRIHCRWSPRAGQPRAGKRCSRTSARAWWMRDFTVPSGMPRWVAISR
jgi:hypothetical protein